MKSMASSKQSNLFLLLTQDVTNNLGFKFNDVCNLIVKIINANNWIYITKDRKHGGFCFSVQKIDNLKKKKGALGFMVFFFYIFFSHKN